MNYYLLFTIVIMIAVFVLIPLLDKWTKSKKRRGGRNPRRGRRR